MSYYIQLTQEERNAALSKEILTTTVAVNIALAATFTPQKAPRPHLISS